MASPPSSIVVVGAGQAGSTLVQTLRAEGYSGPLTLIGEEPDPPYQRPPLSKKYLLGEMTAERLLLKPESFYADHDIRLITGQPVTAIDRIARTVTAGAETLPYGALALATGAFPRRLPETIGGALPGVHLVRSRSDVDRMAPDIAEGRHVLIVGGGYIGLEAAAVAAQRGMRVTLIEMAERILNRVACTETAAYLAALHREHGVDIREGTGLTRLDPGADGRVASAELSTGERLDIDMCVAGIGIVPDTRLAEAAGLRIENGIATDAHTRTSDPAIHAAGDCASFPHQGQRIRLESVQNAIDMAAHAARAMLGDPAPYCPYPWFWSDQYAARLQIAGLSTGYTRVVDRPGHRPGGRSFWYFAQDRLIAVDAVSDPKAYMQGKRWIEAGHSPDPDALADPDRDLRDLA